MSTPFFLTFLELQIEADERDIRRAYAKRLKLIDQESDPDGFQRLRHAYESALSWAQSRAAQIPDRTEVDAVPTHLRSSLEPDPFATESELVNEPESSDSTSLKVHVVPAFQLAEAAYERFLKGLDRPLRERDRAVAALEKSLNDPDLTNLDARNFFEGLVARGLAQGWQPGHEVLLVAAIDCFEWNRDRYRLAQFGQVGYFIDASINERAAFDGQAPAYKDLQRQLIQAMRVDDRPGEKLLVTGMGQLELLLTNFPHWMHLVTPVNQANVWRAWHQSLTPQQRRAHEQAPPTPVAKPASPITLLWVFLAFIWVVAQVAKMSAQAPADKIPIRPSPTLSSGSELLSRPTVESNIPGLTDPLSRFLPPDQLKGSNSGLLPPPSSTSTSDAPITPTLKETSTFRVAPPDAGLKLDNGRPSKFSTNAPVNSNQHPPLPSLETTKPANPPPK